MKVLRLADLVAQALIASLHGGGNAQRAFDVLKPRVAKGELSPRAAASAILRDLKV